MIKPMSKVSLKSPCKHFYTLKTPVSEWCVNIAFKIYSIYIALEVGTNVRIKRYVTELVKVMQIDKKFVNCHAQQRSSIL